jgi:hypothetical protein
MIERRREDREKKEEKIGIVTFCGNSEIVSTCSSSFPLENQLKSSCPVSFLPPSCLFLRSFFLAFVLLVRLHLPVVFTVNDLLLSNLF